MFVPQGRKQTDTGAGYNRKTGDFQTVSKWDEQCPLQNMKSQNQKEIVVNNLKNKG